MVDRGHADEGRVKLPPGITHLSACVMIERDDRFAAILSRKHSGSPELPGGKANPGESPEDCARRETREEVGVELIALTPLTVMDIAVPGSAQVHRCTVFAATIAAEAELRGSAEGPAAWVTADDLLKRGTYRDTVARPLFAFERHRTAARRMIATGDPGGLRRRVEVVVRALGMTMEGWVVEESFHEDAPTPDWPYRARIIAPNTLELKDTLKVTRWSDDPRKARSAAWGMFAKNLRLLLTRRREALATAHKAVALAESAINALDLITLPEVP